MTTLLDMMKLANKLKRVALASEMRHFGVTIIVHAAEPSTSACEVAVATTLPSRAHQRALLAEVLAQSVLANGGELEDVGAIAVSDHATRMGGERES